MFVCSREHQCKAVLTLPFVSALPLTLLNGTCLLSFSGYEEFICELQPTILLQKALSYLSNHQELCGSDALSFPTRV